MILRYDGFPFVVSIRSPYRSKGRSAREFDYFVPCEFQSAPLTEARGDQVLPLLLNHKTSFNPLPLPKQGEILP